MAAAAVFRESEQGFDGVRSRKNRAEAQAALSGAGEADTRTAMNEYVMNLWHSRDDSISRFGKRFCRICK